MNLLRVFSAKKELIKGLFEVSLIDFDFIIINIIIKI